MSRPRFSFIVPFYDCAAWLERAVASVLAQEGDDWELLLVDDGSRDGSAELARRLARQGPVRLLKQANAGPGAARNRGAAAARGEYLWFLDCDDELLPDALAKVRPVLQAHPETALLVGGYLRRSPDGKEVLQLPAPLSEDRAHNFRRFLARRLGSYSHGALVVARRVFPHLRYPEGLRNNEDLVFHAQLLANHPCRTLSQPLARIHQRPDSLRHQGADRDTSAEIARLLFDPHKLPAALLPLRKGFETGRRLSHFRRLYRTGRHAEARHHYLETLRRDPRALFKWSYLRKYLRTLLPGSSHDP